MIIGVSEQFTIRQTEEIQEPAKVVLNDVEYMVEDMSEEGRYLYAQCQDLAKKKQSRVFKCHFAILDMSIACWSLVTGTAFDLCIVAIPRMSVPVYLGGSLRAVDPIVSSREG